MTIYQREFWPTPINGIGCLAGGRVLRPAGGGATPIEVSSFV
jgi:hypothetical protein